MARTGVVDVASVVDGIVRSALAGADELLRAGATLSGPTVHLLCGDLAAPYVGYVTCRPFRPGRDAASAVGLLGRLPSVLAATHLVVVWEYAALREALEPSGGRAASGLAIVTASMTDHVVHWHPFRCPPGAGAVEWGPPSQHANAVLPLPVEDLLETWRRLVDDDLPATVDMLERAGYLVRCAARS